MSAKKKPKRKTTSAPKKSGKVRDGVTMADYLEPIEPASPAADMEIVGTTSRPGRFAVRGVATGGGVGVRGESNSNFGVEGKGGARGVFGEGLNGVEGVGVFGVVGRAVDGDGGRGVRGEGAIGVFGTSSRAGFAAVLGDHTGAGVGVRLRRPMFSR
jgi:hypothetical protein